MERVSAPALGALQGEYLLQQRGRTLKGAGMGQMESRNIDAPDETRPFQAHGHMDVVTLGDFTLGKGVFEPGWRWSTDVKPIAGTDSCMTRHTGICLSGEMAVRTDEGTEGTIGPGDVFVLEPGHDAWTVGDEPCVLFDTGVAAYARPAR